MPASQRCWVQKSTEPRLIPETQKLADEIGLKNVADSIDAFKDKELELIVDYAGFGTTTAQGIETLGKFGAFVQVGMGRLESTISTYTIIINQLTIKGSQSGSKQDLAENYELMRSGELNPPMNHITHEDIPEALNKLREGGEGSVFHEYSPCREIPTMRH